MNNNSRIVLSDSVRIYSSGTDEIRIRKGVWNYEEAILNYGGLSENLQNAVLKLFDRLEAGQFVDVVDLMDAEQLTPEEKELFSGLIDSLRYQSYVYSEHDSDSQKLLFELLGGSATGGFYAPTQHIRPVLFFGDNQSIREYARMLAKEVDIPLTVMSDAEIKDIAAMDLTTCQDGYATTKQLNEVVRFIERFGCIVGCMEKPHISFLRNINRALVRTSQTLCMALLDGPFTSVFTIKPPETGCFECYELRLLARMQEMTVYRKFVEQSRLSARRKNGNTYTTPLMHALTSQAMFEGFLVSSIGKAKLAGRALNTYLPILEIQVQDILRVPFCPACGFVARAKMEEMYTSTHAIVEKLVSSIIIGEKEPV
ncbi:MAG: hypothetical protein GXP42_09485 [Chloroflexi bacterium]|nr:hypothetical protein [Chloroflexota bacterium]